MREAGDAALGLPARQPLRVGGAQRRLAPLAQRLDVALPVPQTCTHCFFCKQGALSHEVSHEHAYAWHS